MKNGLFVGSDGTKRYWKNGEYHKEDGPAIEYKNGSKYWYINGKRHREDGPAIFSHKGDNRWYLNNIESMFHKEMINKTMLNL